MNAPYKPTDTHIPTLKEMAGNFRRQIMAIPGRGDALSMWTPDTMRDLMACTAAACVEHEQNILLALVAIRDAEDRACGRGYDSDMDRMEDEAKALVEAAEAFAAEVGRRVRHYREDAA